MYNPFLSTPSFIPGSVGSMGSLTAFQPLVGSEDSETARYPTESFLNSAMTANQRLESGSYSSRGSFSLGKSKAGLVFFQNSVWVIRRITAGLLVVDHDIGVGEIDNVVWPDRAAVVRCILGTGAGIARKCGQDGNARLRDGRGLFSSCPRTA